MTLWIGTSWKMNKTVAEAERYIQAFCNHDLPDPKQCQLFVCPPFTALAVVRNALKDLPVLLGAQDCHWAKQGAFTGEISAPMLADVGCDLVEIGHSERRHWFAEDDRRVAKKVRAILNAGMRPLICIGDDQEEKKAGASIAAVQRQALLALSDLEAQDRNRCLLAYEPVWAIGEHGTAADPTFAAAVHAAIKERFPELPILYGGSVNQANAAALMEHAAIDGLFIGRAALDPDMFLQIAKSAHSARSADAGPKSASDT